MTVPGLGHLRVGLQALGQPEIGEQRGLHRLAAFDEHVRGLDVAVHEPARVRRVQRRRDLRDQHRGPHRLQPRLRRHEPREVLAVDVAHRDVEQPLLLARVVDRDHVRVLDRGRRLELLRGSARGTPRRPRRAGGDDLQRHLALERHVHRAIDDAHAAAPRDTADDVLGERRADGEFIHVPAVLSAHRPRIARMSAVRRRASSASRSEKKATNSGTSAHISGWISPRAAAGRPSRRRS